MAEPMAAGNTPYTAASANNVLNQVAEKLQGALKDTGLDKLQAFANGLEAVTKSLEADHSEVSTKLRSGMLELKDLAESATQRPGDLVPGGSLVACAARCYVKTVIRHLREIQDEADELHRRISDLPNSLKLCQQQLVDALQKAASLLGPIIQHIVEIPGKLLNELSKLHSFKDLAKIDLTPIKAAVHIETIAAPLQQLEVMKAAVGVLLDTIRKCVQDIAVFVVRAPNQVVGAFEVKLLCCLKKPEPPKALVDCAEFVHHLALQPVQDMLDQAHSAVMNFDTKSLRKPLEDFSAKALHDLKPLEAAIEAAKVLAFSPNPDGSVPAVVVQQDSPGKETPGGGNAEQKEEPVKPADVVIESTTKGTSCCGSS